MAGTFKKFKTFEYCPTGHLILSMEQRHEENLGRRKSKDRENPRYGNVNIGVHMDVC